MDTTFAYTSASSFLTMPMNNGSMNYSPIALWLALALVAQGTSGQTREQLFSTLGLDKLSPEDYAQSIAALNTILSHTQSKTSVATSVWTREEYTLHMPFLSFARNIFQSDVESVDFSSDAAAEQMSDWIASHTEGSLRPSLHISGAETLSLLSTVYAQGHWRTPFSPRDTTMGTFHGERGDERIPFMHDYWRDVMYLCDETYGWERLDMPFDDGSCLRVVLPDEGHLDALLADPLALKRALGTNPENALSAAEKKELTGAERLKAKLDARKDPLSMPLYVKKVDVNLALPRFEMSTEFPSDGIIDALTSLGIRDAFDPDSADFSQLCDNPLFISSIHQGTHIEVTECGARAAAYTQIMAVAGAVPQFGDEITFTVDRPFFYGFMTRDNIPLFIGAVRNLKVK